MHCWWERREDVLRWKNKKNEKERRYDDDEVELGWLSVRLGSLGHFGWNMVFTIMAAIFIMGFFGVGPVLVGEDCSCSCSSDRNSSVSKCDVHKVQDSMRKKKLPKELKVRCYSSIDISTTAAVLTKMTAVYIVVQRASKYSSTSKWHINRALLLERE